MIERKHLSKKSPGRKGRPGGNYFVEDDDKVEFFHTGSKRLDLELGGGWAERRIINIIGDCLAGDTMVSVLRGARPRKMDLRTLYNRVNGSHRNRDEGLETCLLADVGGYAGTVPLIAVVDSGPKVLYQITDENGNNIKASEDHRFATSEGWKRLSDGLREGSYIKRWRSTRTRDMRNERKTRSYTYSIPFHPFGQRNVVAGRDYKRLLTARLVLEAAINGIDLRELIYILRNDPDTAAALQYSSPEQEVHHLNGNPADDRLENLQLIDPKDHRQLHIDELWQASKSIELAKIKKITKVGKQSSFDVSMEAPYHNFIANGFEVHNSATGKSLLCIEGGGNFLRKYADGKVRYRETEDAFQKGYARQIGLPVEKVDFGEPIETIEDLYEDLERLITGSRGKPELIIVDSLDALSSRAELARKIDQGTYGGEKAKQLSALFRRINHALAKNFTLMVVSQVRDNIGATMFQRKWTRSGGRALTFYSSQIVVLSQLGKIKKTQKKVERVIGVDVRALVDKNKVGPAYGKVEFPIIFNYGIDDEESCRDWLKSVGITATSNDRKKLHELVEQKWQEVEISFKPTKRKYEDA
jgi:RecA/RadA recombinase